MLQESACAPSPRAWFGVMSAVVTQQALVEGLRLRVAGNKTGYFGVRLAKPGQPKPFHARVWHGGKQVHLGSFATAEEAAVCVAWWMEEPKAAAEKAAVTSWHQDMEGTWHEVDADGGGRHGAASGGGGGGGGGGWYQDAKGMWHEEAPMLALQAAGLAEEGLAQLEEEIEARQHDAGDLGARFDERQPGRLKVKPYEDQVRRAGSVVSLGRLAADEQAALWRAQQEESGRAQDSGWPAQEGRRSRKRARHAHPEVRHHHHRPHHRPHHRVRRWANEWTPRSQVLTYYPRSLALTCYPRGARPTSTPRGVKASTSPLRSGTRHRRGGRHRKGARQSMRPQYAKVAWYRRSSTRPL